MNYFEGMRVVELAGVLAGPATGMFFAELGAEVIKVENKRTGGDVTRQWKLPAEDVDDPLSAYYRSVNWGKRAVLLDLTDASDRNELDDLLTGADILLTNFKSGSAERFGLDARTVVRKHPKLIHVNFTAFGDRSDKPGFDVLLQAETGFLSMNGPAGGPPVKLPVALIDLLAGHQAKEAVLIALLQRSRTGLGASISVSLYDSALASLANQASNFLNTGAVPVRKGMQHPNICPYGDLLTAADGTYVVLAAGTEDHFQKLCKALELPRLVSDARFADNPARLRHRAGLMAELNRSAGKLSGKELLDRLSEHGVPAGPIRDLAGVFGTDAARRMVLKHPDGAKCVSTVAFEIRLNPARDTGG